LRRSARDLHVQRLEHLVGRDLQVSFARRLRDERKFGVVEEVKARLKKAGAKFSDIDGVRVSTKDGWWLLRASNTQAVLVARAEANDQAGLERLKAHLAKQLEQSGVALPDKSTAGH